MTVSPTPSSINIAGGGRPSGQRQGLQHVDESLLTSFHEIFSKYAGPNNKWDKGQISIFSEYVQAEDLDSSSADLGVKDEWEFGDFLRYMSSSGADALTPALEQDLSHPLSQYFISSSHNTYLTGNQLSSDSSTEAYKDVLLRGCRCIEIDVWDGEEFLAEEYLDEEDKDKSQNGRGKKLGRRARLGIKLAKWAVEKFEKPEILAETGGFEGRLVGMIRAEPRVLHGFTLTKEILFRDVCETVRQYAFVKSDLPLIVSLEVHCSPRQQGAMVDIMKEAWGEFLLPEPDVEPSVLPSPEDLKRKILIKVKYVPPEQPLGSDTESTLSLDPENDTAGGAKKPKPAKITQGLSRLGVYTRGVSFQSLSQPEAEMPVHIFSLSEPAAIELHRRQPLELFRHNMEFLMRTYPAGSRIDSSNFDPGPFWRMGIQVVALNWQNWDEGMMLNEGMFSGSDGYVLKPDGYRGAVGSGGGGDPETWSQPDLRQRTLDRLAIHVLAAQDIPMANKTDNPNAFQPYIKVELHTDPSIFAPVPVDDDSGHAKGAKFRAQTANAKGTSPRFGEEVLDFQNVEGVVPELAFVSFVVMNDVVGPDELAAWACVRLDRLKSGFRCVRLIDKRGVASKGVLLVKIEQRYAQTESCD